MIIGEEAAYFSIQRDAPRPVDRIISRVGVSDDRTLADVFAHLPAVAAGIERRDHAAPVRAFPKTDVERNAHRRVFRRARAADARRRSPRQLLGRETLEAHVSEDARQRSGKTETVGQHIFGAGLAELSAKVLSAVKNLPDDRFGRRRVDVAFFHRRAGGKPTARGHVLFQLPIIFRPVFFHQAITIRAAEIENVVRILFKQREVVVHGLGQIFAYDLRILPAPLRVQVRIANDVKGWLLRQIGIVGGLTTRTGDGQ